MATFSFPNHSFSTEYPDNGFRAKLGNSYQYAAAPVAPDQRIFKLEFKAMKYFTTPSGDIDRSVFPEINLALLEDFYNLHRMHLTFTYPHPVYGDVPVKFNKPLILPKGEEGGNGLIKNIQIEFLEQPGLSDSGVSDMTLIVYEDFP